MFSESVHDFWFLGSELTCSHDFSGSPTNPHLTFEEVTCHSRNSQVLWSRSPESDWRGCYLLSRQTERSRDRSPLSLRRWPWKADMQIPRGHAYYYYYSDQCLAPRNSLHILFRSSCQHFQNNTVIITTVYIALSINNCSIITGILKTLSSSVILS